jgi:signal transduction histidine kinase
LDLILDVADNGPGIPDENIHKVFEPFFSTKGSMGTGLGLAVTRKTVREHGGDIAVSRCPEGGALFRMTLPDVGRRPSYDS